MPVVVDSNRFWSIHRADVYTRNHKRRLVIAGASRAQLGLVPSVMEECLPGYKVKQLTIDGSPAFEIIRDLCEDQAFHGVILWSAISENLSPRSDILSKDIRYTRFYHDEFWRVASVEKNLNCLISAFLQSLFVTLSPNLTLRAMLNSEFVPKVSYINLQFNRYRPARYYEVMTASEREEHRQKRIQRRASSTTKIMHISEFIQFLRDDLAPLHEKLRSRGGQLVLLRMPTTGEHWRMDNERMPKQLYWDQIEKQTGIPAIHFKDYSELMEFDCPDTSHLDMTDAPEFTRRMSEILQKKLFEK